MSQNRERVFLLFSLTLLLVFATGCADKSRPTGVFDDHGDIGECLLKGDLRVEKATYTLSGSGENIWFDTDQFHYAWVETGGDFILRARISFSGEGHHPHRKAGWMVRSALNDSSAHVSGAVHGDGLTSLQFRRSEGAITEELKSGAVSPDAVQLERRKNVYYFTAAENGRVAETVTLADVDLGEKVYAGIFICSHDNGVLEQAVFSEVEIITNRLEKTEPFGEYAQRVSDSPASGLEN